MANTNCGKQQQMILFLLRFLELIFPRLTQLLKNLQLVGGNSVGYLQSVVDLSQGSPKKNPHSDQSGI